jgi:hypothetical protein
MQGRKLNMAGRPGSRTRQSRKLRKASRLESGKRQSRKLLAGQAGQGLEQGRAGS